MPEISSFFGIVISMYFSDHAPPHFHATYNEYDVMIAIETGAVMGGKCPPRILGFLQEWRALHMDELMANWHHAMTDGKFAKIKPLE